MSDAKYMSVSQDVWDSISLMRWEDVLLDALILSIKGVIDLRFCFVKSSLPVAIQRLGGSE